MKPVITAILLFISLSSIGQTNFHFDSSNTAIDSLFARLIILARSIQNYDSSIAAPSISYKYTITEKKGDSLILNFLDNNSKLLYRKVNRYDKSGCRWWEVDEIYNSSSKLVYWEALKWSCLKPEEKNDPDIKYFDALMYERERYVYDSVGRIKERIWLYTPFNNVRRYKYSYNKEGNQSYTMTKHAYDSFWE